MKTDKMVQMRLGGTTYREIAEESGLTMLAAYGRIRRKGSEEVTHVRGKGFCIDRIVYRGLYEHFLNDKYETISSFARKVYSGSEGFNIAAVRNILLGLHDSRFTIHQIKRICEIVGKPFEEVFEVREAGENRAI